MSEGCTPPFASWGPQAVLLKPEPGAGALTGRAEPHKNPPWSAGTLCLKASCCTGHLVLSAGPPSPGLLRPAWPRLGAVPPPAAPVQTPVSPSRGFLVASNACHRHHSRFNVLNQIRYSQLIFTWTYLAPEPIVSRCKNYSIVLVLLRIKGNLM